MIVRPVVMCVVLAGGCARPAPLPPVVDVPTPELPAPDPPWPGTLAAVLAAVDSGRFAAADSMLAAFEQSATGTPDASESAFWRALLQTDPQNPAFSPATARAALQAYLGTPSATRRGEATVVLRLLTVSDSLRAANAGARAAMEQRDQTREEEMRRLRDELQRAQAELERIKRRLGSPRP